MGVIIILIVAFCTSILAIILVFGILYFGNKLNSLGWEAVNSLNNGRPTEASYNEHMLRDLDMLAECRAIFMLKGWEHSKGARIEFADGC